MKKVLLLFVASLFIQKLLAQEVNMYNEIINRSLEIYIENELEENVNMIASGIGVGKIDFSEFYIDLEGFPRDFKFSKNIIDYGFHFIYLQEAGVYEIFKKERPVLLLLGPQIDGNRLKISILSAAVYSEKANHLLFTTPEEGPFSCTWKYSCETQKWEFEKSGKM